MDNKFRGILLGLAVGDAMGGPLEFMSNNQVQIKHGNVTGMIGGGWLHLRPGQYTEDTILMMAVAESLMEYRELKLDDITKRYLKWYRGNPQDIGQVMRATMALIYQGHNIEIASAKAHEEMSGPTDDSDPLPRSVPLALLYFDLPSRLMQETVRAVKLTHFDKKVISSAVTLNLLLSRILNGETDRNKITQQVAQILDENELGLYNMLPDIGNKKIQELRSSSRVQDTLETAFWALWKTKSYRDAIVTVINMGGDADTIGAITGALAGAYYGEEGIPEQWLKSLEDKNIITGFANRLYKMASNPKGVST